MAVKRKQHRDDQKNEGSEDHRDSPLEESRKPQIIEEDDESGSKKNLEFRVGTEIHY